MCLIAFSIPFPFICSTIGIWVLLAAWLFGENPAKSARRFSERPALWPWVVFFFLYAASYFWSEDKDQSVFDTISKLSFVLMPLCVGAGPDLSLRGLRNVADALAMGCCSVALVCLTEAAREYLRTGSTARFFYHELVQGFDANAVYMGWYVMIALAGLLLIPRASQPGILSRLARTLGALLLIAFLILLSSRLLLVIFLLLIVPMYILRILQHQARRWQTALLVVAVTGGLAGAIALTGNPVSKRFRDVMHRDVQVAYLKDYRDTVPHFNNVTLRLFAWRVGWENVRDHNLWLLGSGNGDEHRLQNERFIELGITPERQLQYNIPVNNMNLHNMFVQSLLALGIPGLMLFCLIIFLPFAALHRAPFRSFFLLFHCSALLFMLQESALQTQAGIVFYAFFVAIYWNAVKSREEKGETDFQKR